MKKSEKVLYTVFKVIYVLTTAAIVTTYLSELLSPTTVNCSISSNDWLTLGCMSCVCVLIAERERKEKALKVNND